MHATPHHLAAHVGAAHAQKHHHPPQSYPSLSLVPGQVQRGLNLCLKMKSPAQMKALMQQILEVQEATYAALESLQKLATAGEAPFDLFFIDADKRSIPEYFDWALRMSRPGTLIVVDNVVRDGKVADAASGDPDVLGVRRLVERLAHEPRVTATAIQTVGSKGYDGFLLARVNAPTVTA